MTLVARSPTISSTSKATSLFAVYGVVDRHDVDLAHEVERQAAELVGAKEAPRLLGVKDVYRVVVRHGDLLGMPYGDCLATTHGSKNWGRRAGRVTSPRSHDP